MLILIWKSCPNGTASSSYNRLTSKSRKGVVSSPIRSYPIPSVRTFRFPILNELKFENNAYYLTGFFTTTPNEVDHSFANME